MSDDTHQIKRRPVPQHEYDPEYHDAEHQSQRDRFLEPTQRALSFRPNGAWFKHQALNLRDFFVVTWLDWLTFVVIGAVAIGVWFAPVTFTRLFALSDPTHTISYPYLSHPIFSPAAAGALAALVPLATFLLAQLWQHSFTDFGAAVLGLAYSMVTATCFQVILKKTIGGLRPHFLAVCEPVVPEDLVGRGYEGVMYSPDQVCTGDPSRISNAITSFPSGHSAIAFSGFGYLAIYLFTHLGITSRSRRRGSFWRMLFVVAPLLLATYLAGTLILGYHHHGYDVLFGSVIGWVMAYLGYRTVFKAVWDARWNCVTYLVLPPRGKGREKRRNEDLPSEDRREPTTNGMVHLTRAGGGDAANGNGSAV